MKVFGSNRCNRWYNHCNGLNNLNIKLSQKHPATKLHLSVAADPLSVVTDHLEKICVVSSTTTLTTNPYISCNEINHSRSKIIQK
jgi:hypothetical protein